MSSFLTDIFDFGITALMNLYRLSSKFSSNILIVVLVVIVVAFLCIIIDFSVKGCLNVIIGSS